MNNPHEPKNQQYRDACEQALSFLVAELRKRGVDAAINTEWREVVRSTLDKDGISVCTDVEIKPMFPHGYGFHPKAMGFLAKVCRAHRPVQYRLKTEDVADWKNLPWEKIITTHTEELNLRWSSRKHYNEQIAQLKEMRRLADAEVAIPDSLHDLSRERKPDGTYSITVSASGLSADTVRKIRDILILEKARKA